VEQLAMGAEEAFPYTGVSARLTVFTVIIRRGDREDFS